MAPPAPSSLATARSKAYLPSKQIAIAVATTFGEESFFPDAEGDFNPRTIAPSWEIFAVIGAYLAPDEAPPAMRR